MKKNTIRSGLWHKSHSKSEVRAINFWFYIKFGYTVTILLRSPDLAYNLIHSIEILGNTISALTTQGLEKIEAKGDRCLAYAEASLALLNGGMIRRPSLAVQVE